MPFFLHESLLWWGLPLVGAPILIHLINMMRHRRVKWAAMEFLLVSQKKHRTWIILKQLLLLLLRMAAIAAVVGMVAQPLLRNQLGGLFGNARTHHVVLLDDSYSMSDHWAETSAFREAKRVVKQLAAHAARQDTAQTFSLIRFSRASQGAAPDLLDKPLEGGFLDSLDKTLTSLNVSQAAASPDDALASIDTLSQAKDENRVVYLVSDFRGNQWDDPETLRKTLAGMQDSADLHLINCVDAARPNLAIESLQPGPGTRAAGVPLVMELTVRNYGTVAVKEITVQLEEDGQKRAPVVFEKIAPGKSEMRRFQVMFPAAGQHGIAAQLPDDSVAADDGRYAVVDFAGSVPILIVDGDPQAADAYFLNTALSPGGKINSGLKPIIEPARALTRGSLDKYETIFLLNIERLDEPEIAALEAYVKAGGGVGFFMGELSRADFFNKQLYRDGQGLFPLPLAGPMEMLVDREEQVPDLEVSDHPIFSVFAGERNSFISTVNVQRYFAAPRDWAPAADDSTKVIARLRNKAPLAVEHKFGDGRVIAFLTKAAPVETTLGSWNNWGRNNPSYVVAMLELQSYLSAQRRPDNARVVGSPLLVSAEAGRYQPQVRFLLPQDKAGGALTVDAEKTPSGLAAKLTETGASGVYEAQLTTADGNVELRRYAFNVEPDEGDLKRLDGQQLASRLPGVRYKYYEAKDVNYDTRQLAGFNLGDSLMYVLVGLLLGEQVLAYFTSYHPARRGAAR